MLVKVTENVARGRISFIMNPWINLAARNLLLDSVLYVSHFVTLFRSSPSKSMLGITGWIMRMLNR